MVLKCSLCWIHSLSTEIKLGKRIAVFKVEMQDQQESLHFLAQQVNGWTKAPKLSLQQDTQVYTPSEFPKDTFYNWYVPWDILKTAIFKVCLWKTIISLFWKLNEKVWFWMFIFILS